ncbi:DNA methyltransferase [Candidatus Methanarcanum hacksteinii]|uniref:DNA methyltransferase n=1 Tax=Candidatus Methanarcanum hacksteinii TaxID=2911857 RepID=UPI0037DC0E48
MIDPWFDKLDKFHPYPAKFPLKIALEHIQEYTKEGDTVYDPFVGSGTTLIASSMLNRFSFGCDINHIAVLLSKFKTSYYSPQDLCELSTFYQHLRSINCDNYNVVLNDYSSINHWFCKEAIAGLSILKNEISAYFDKDSSCDLFCKSVLSSIINIVSNQESDTRYAAIPRFDIKIQDVLDLFCKKYDSTKQIVEHTIRDKSILDHTDAYLCNSKETSRLINRKANMIVTSPPYPNTYDYYLYHKHRMLWLDYDFEESKNLEIGSRNEFSSKKQPSTNFTNDLTSIFEDCDRLLLDDSYIVIIIGDGVIRGDFYDSFEHTVDICDKLGWRLEKSFDLELDKTSRSFNKNFRTAGKKEHTIIFKK